ncbi:ABC transporter permease [Rhizobium alvei]|uniref:ABC transporter permease n=1 Tax=Rhizobium alvei TaxID=1132659 RepID=A0ABT8YHR3_9HYPH|nr:ABC transporter permease [Rhizobium alvei]MDO6963134.1 ABC transporter permease [Rhizobium alvei]
MNLAFRDIRYKLGRFVLTCLGLSLLLGVVVSMAGIYRGQTADALALLKTMSADIWVVEAGSHGPFAEASRVPGDTRELIARIHGVERAGSLTLQTMQIERGGKRMRLQVVGFEPGQPGAPETLVEGRTITSSHYEIIADRQTRLQVGEQLKLGKRTFTVVGLTQGVVTLSGDSVLYMTLKDAQELQFEIAPTAARREAARGAQKSGTDFVNAVVARISPNIPASLIASEIARWKHLSVLTAEDQETLLTRTVIERASRQLGLFMSILTLVSAVIIALIVYTMTLDKTRDIATLKMIGAPDRTIIGLIVQQALIMGMVGFVVGTGLVYAFQNVFPRRIEMLPSDIGALFIVVIFVCLAASALGVRVAVKVDPSTALAG